MVVNHADKIRAIHAKYILSYFLLVIWSGKKHENSK